MKKNLAKVIVFLLITMLFTAPKQKTIKVNAEESCTWTEVATITNGRHYIISVTRSIQEKYYLKAGEHTQTPINTELIFDETLSFADAWTFIGDENNGYTITDFNGNRLYLRKSYRLWSEKDISASYSAYKNWQYINNKLSNNIYYLSNFTDRTDDDWRAATSTESSNYNTDIILYEYTPTVTEELERFISIKAAWLDRDKKGKCEEFVPPILAYYDGLSDDAKELFSSDEGYASHYGDIVYFSGWYASIMTNNGEVLNLKASVANRSFFFLMLVSALSFSGYILLLRYKKAHE